MTRLRSTSLVFLGLFSGGLLAGCDEEKPQVTKAEKVDAGARAVDPNLARAVAAASAVPQQGVQQGPPANGVFAPGEADKRMAKGALPTVELGNEGSGTKVQLDQLLPKPGAKQNLTVTLAFQPGPRVPPVETTFELAFEVLKPKAAAEGAAPEPLAVSVKVTKVTPEASIVGELAKKLGELKGSKIDYQLAPNGGALGLNVALPKGVPTDLEDLLRSVAENLMVAMVAFPAKPVGQGAVWMASSRDAHQGTDAIAYRMVKLLKLTGEGGAGTKLELEVNSKYYAADTSIRRPGIPAGINPVVAQFRSEGQATIIIELGKPAPAGLTNLSTAIVMSDSADPSKQMSMQGGSQLVMGAEGMTLANQAAAARAAEAAAAQQQLQGMPPGMIDDDELPE